MTRIRLPKVWANRLAEQAESGMGYHKVDITFEDGSLATGCFVFNGEDVELLDEHVGKEIFDITLCKTG